MNQRDIGTEIVRKKQETLKGIELKLLEEAFMPSLNNSDERLGLYATYYKNKYEVTPIQAKETRILYRTISDLIDCELQRRGDNKWTTH